MDVREKLTHILTSDPEMLKNLNVSTIKLYRLVDKLIANGVTVQEWISVKDMLPQVETPVIVYGGNGISIDWLKDYGEQGLRWGNLCCGSYNAKCWQPMPQPPKGE